MLLEHGPHRPVENEDPLLEECLDLLVDGHRRFLPSLPS
jgi:hypothetical protein